MTEWASGTPKETGWYVVAILYKNGMGTIGCATWNGPLGWSLESDHIIAFIPVNTLLLDSKVEWPEHLMPLD